MRNVNKRIRDARVDKAGGILYFLKLKKKFPDNQGYPKIIASFKTEHEQLKKKEQNGK